jgi:hypothetical protein
MKENPFFRFISGYEYYKSIDQQKDKGSLVGFGVKRA